MHSEKCPVCDGIGQVPIGFYSRHPFCPCTFSSLSMETCKSCSGRGYIFVPDENPIPQHYELDPPVETSKSGN